VFARQCGKRRKRLFLGHNLEALTGTAGESGRKESGVDQRNHEDLGMMEVDNVVNDLATSMPEEMMGRHVMQ
jgi:hypothetical protein